MDKTLPCVSLSYKAGSLGSKHHAAGLTERGNCCLRKLTILGARAVLVTLSMSETPLYFPLLVEHQ
jgi:hypothetical protein